MFAIAIISGQYTWKAARQIQAMHTGDSPKKSAYSFSVFLDQSFAVSTMTQAVVKHSRIAVSFLEVVLSKASKAEIPDRVDVLE